MAHWVDAASTAVTSAAANTRRNVDADGGTRPTANAYGEVAAHWAIATQELASAITACGPSRNTDCRPYDDQASGADRTASTRATKSAADNGGDGARVASNAVAKAHRKEEIAVTGLLAGRRRRRHLWTTTRSVPVTPQVNGPTATMPQIPRRQPQD
jgi:hypothetical protein